VRAKPLSTDDRRAMIIDAVIPLLMEHGRAVTTRQIADAADVAEGTIFRVFADKDALIDAAVNKFLDATAANRQLRAIDPELPLEAKVNDILFQLRGRMKGIFGIMNAVGMSGPPALVELRRRDRGCPAARSRAAPDSAGPDRLIRAARRVRVSHPTVQPGPRDPHRRPGPRHHLWNRRPPGRRGKLECFLDCSENT